MDSKPTAAKELTMQDGIDFGVFSVESQDKITKNIEEKNQDEKTTETDIKFSIEFPGNYTPSGQLKQALKEQNAEKTEESGFKQASPYDELGLLFLTNTSINTSGFFLIYFHESNTDYKTHV